MQLHFAGSMSNSFEANLEGQGWNKKPHADKDTRAYIGHRMLFNIVWNSHIAFLP